MAPEPSIVEDAKASSRHMSVMIGVLGDKLEWYEREYDKMKLRNAEITVQNDVLWNLCHSMRSALEKCDFADEVYLNALDNTLRKIGIEV
jgi:hypothetical protein